MVILSLQLMVSFQLSVSIEGPPDDGGHLTGLERLHDESANADLPDSLLVYHLAVSGAQNDRQIRPDLQQPPGKLNSRHVRHCDIRDHEIETVRIGPERLQCVEAARPCNDPVAQMVQ